MSRAIADNALSEFQCLGSIPQRKRVPAGKGGFAEQA